MTTQKGILFYLSRKLRFFDYFRCGAFIGFSVIKNMEVYILINTDKLLKELSKNEMARLRRGLYGISHVLTKTQHL